MGASNFVDVIAGDSVEDAYRKAVAQAYWEYGHDSYNGTISTTHGVVDVNGLFPVDMPDDKKMKLADVSLNYGNDLMAWNEELSKLVKVTDDEQLAGFSSSEREIVKKLASKGIEKWEKCGGFKLQTGEYYFFGWAAE
jgi:hypothetical protein